MNRILRVEGDWLRGLGWDFWSTFILYVSSLPCILVIFQSLLCVCDWLGTIRNNRRWTTEPKFDGMEGKEIWAKILERGLIGLYQKVSLLSISPTYTFSNYILHLSRFARELLPPFLSRRSRNSQPHLSRASRFARDAREVQSTRWPECIWLDDSLLTICVEGISVEKTTLPLNTLLIPIFPSSFLKCSVEWLLIISTSYMFVYGSWRRGRAVLLDTVLFICSPNVMQLYMLPPPCICVTTLTSSIVVWYDGCGICKFHTRCAMRNPRSRAAYQHAFLITNLSCTSSSPAASYLLFNNNLVRSTPFSQIKRGGSWWMPNNSWDYRSATYPIWWTSRMVKW
jgi:hypothetical protein